nr:hypothetical protein [Pseudobdellovibrionaceae bacterium]
MVISVGTKGRDFLKFETTEETFPLRVLQLVEMRGCDHFLNQVKILKSNSGKDISLWKIPFGSNHVDLLIKELILKVRGEWDHPVQYDEVCHCRQISAQDIDTAIVWGAHSS